MHVKLWQLINSVSNYTVSGFKKLYMSLDAAQHVYNFGLNINNIVFTLSLSLSLKNTKKNLSEHTQSHQFFFFA